MKNNNNNDNSTIYTVLYRVNVIKPFLQNIIVTFSSYPALLIEVFTRKKFGERYLPFVSCLTAIAIMLFICVIENDWMRFLSMMFKDRSAMRRPSDDLTLAEFMVVVFALAALFKSVVHLMESKRDGLTIDFKRYSRSYGIAHEYWYKLAEYLPDWLYARLPVTDLTLRRYYEPFTAMGLGFILIFLPFTRLLGFILFVCGAFYYMRVRIQYSWRKDYLLDQIDKLIIAEEMHGVFVEDKSSDESRGFMVMAPKPKSQDLKELFYQAMKKDFEMPASQEAEIVT